MVGTVIGNFTFVFSMCSVTTNLMLQLNTADFTELQLSVIGLLRLRKFL